MTLKKQLTNLPFEDGLIKELKIYGSEFSKKNGSIVEEIKKIINKDREAIYIFNSAPWIKNEKKETKKHLCI